MKELALEDITILDLQPRAGTDEDTVASYAEAIRGGGEFPPVVVFHDGRDYHLADGFHRVLAYKREEYTHLWAEVKGGSREDAVWYGSGANLKHGLRRTNADKRCAVEAALSVKPDLSDRAIAEHCGVGADLVGSVRINCRKTTVERKSNNDNEKPNEFSGKRTGKDGKKRGKQAKTSQRAVLKDDIGRPVPEEIAEAWERQDEVDEVVSLIVKARKAVKAAQGDPFWGECNLDTAMVELGNAMRELKLAYPHAVCPVCHGRGASRRSCRLCGKRGYVSKFKWENAVSEQMRAATLKMVK